MRANRVRPWVEVVGSVMKNFIAEFNEIPPCAKRDESKQLVEDEFEVGFQFVPGTVCQRTNSKVAGPAVYKNIAEFNEIEICTAYSGKSGQTNHEAIRKDSPAGTERAPQTECNDHKCSTCWEAPSIGPERGRKTP